MSSLQEAEIRHQQEMAIARHQLEQQEQEKAQLAALATPEPAPEPEVGQSGDAYGGCMWGVAMGGGIDIKFTCTPSLSHLASNLHTGAAKPVRFAAARHTYHGASWHAHALGHRQLAQVRA